MKKLLPYLILLVTSYTTFAQSNDFTLLSEQDRARVVDEILQDRVENLLPKLMKREGLDMWILISREYNEDPVMRTFLPSTWLSARRRTIMVFFDNQETGK
ncbi:MAG: Xaa-Pro aminopeptidase, partial [Bacteroidota bacterium]